MKTFHFKSEKFELLLEDCEDPVAIFEEVLSRLPSEDTSGISVSDAPPQGSIEASQTTAGAADAISIDSFMAQKKPTSCRKMLEYTAIYIRDHMNKETFTKDDLIRVATSSKYFKNDWRNHISVNISRMIDSGFLVHLFSGDYRVKE